ncbi:MAG: hypothetical protein WEE64_07760 [Dehalococcoidia bacterium]
MGFLSFFVASWIGRIIGLLLSLVILAVAFFGIIGVLAATGGPGACTPGGGPITVSDANAAAFQTKWDAFAGTLNNGQPATVTFNESEVSSRANQWARDESIDFDADILVCIHDGSGEATATFGGGWVDSEVSVTGTVTIEGTHPQAHVDDIELGNVPGFMIGPFEGRIEDAIQEALDMIDLDEHTYTVTLTEGSAQIDGTP